MPLSIENKIIEKVKKPLGVLFFFTDDFIAFGTSKAVSKTLERLVAKDEVKRVARGIYTRPKISKLVGEVMPTTEEVAR